MFATTRIPAGQVIIEWGGVVMGLEGVLAGKARPLSVVQINDGRFLVDPVDGPAQPDEYMNHSCDSNLWMSSDVTLSTRRDIEPGEELTCDYALFRNTHWISDPEFRMTCRCGVEGCRGLVTGEDHLIAEVRSAYQGGFAPYLLNDAVLVPIHAVA